MSRKKIEKTSSFMAVDGDGKRHAISVFTTFTEFRPVAEPAQWLPGTQAYKMDSNGNHVNLNDDGSLTEVATGKALRRT